VANLSVSYDFKWSDIAQVFSRSKIQEILNQILANELAKPQSHQLNEIKIITSDSNT